MTMSANSATITPSRNLLRFGWEFPYWFYGVILYLASLFLTGYHIYYSNQAIQLPLVHLLTDSSLYPGDPFAATLPHYASMLWRVVALMHRFMAMEPLLLILFLLERALVIYASGHLALALSPRSRLSAVGAMVMFALVPLSILGDGTIVANYFEQTGLSIPFFLLAIAAFYRERPVLWAVWLAIGFNLNSMYGAYALTYFAALLLIDHRYRHVWRRWGLSLLLFALLASPAILFTARAFGISAPNNALWISVSQVRFPHHLYPLTWGKTGFVKFGMLVLLNIVLLYQIRARRRKLFTHGVVWAGISVCWLLYAFVSAYWTKSPSMLVMHPARGTDLWYCFVGITLISLFAVKAEENAGRNRFLVVCLFASIVFWHPVPIPLSVVLLMIMGLMCEPLWEYVLRKGDSSRLALVLVLLVALMGAYSLTRTGLIPQKCSTPRFIILWFGRPVNHR